MVIGHDVIGPPYTVNGCPACGLPLPSATAISPLADAAGTSVTATHTTAANARRAFVLISN